MAQVTWEDATNNWSPSSSHFVGGHGYDGECLYIGRLKRENGFLIGKVSPSVKEKGIFASLTVAGKGTSFSLGNKSKEHFQLMKVPPNVQLKWVRTNGKRAPNCAVQLGTTVDGKKQFITRILHRTGEGKLNEFYGGKKICKANGEVTINFDCLAIDSWKDADCDILCVRKGKVNVPAEENKPLTSKICPNGTNCKVPKKDGPSQPRTRALADADARSTAKKDGEKAVKQVKPLNHDCIEKQIKDTNDLIEKLCPERVKNKISKEKYPRRINVEVLVDDLLIVDALLDTGAERMVMGQNLLDELNKLRKSKKLKAKIVKPGEELIGLGENRIEGGVTAIKLTWGECKSYESVVVVPSEEQLILDMNYITFTKPVISWAKKKAYTKLSGTYKSHAFADDPVQT